MFYRQRVPQSSALAVYYSASPPSSISHPTTLYLDSYANPFTPTGDKAGPLMPGSCNLTLGDSYGSMNDRLDMPFRGLGGFTRNVNSKVPFLTLDYVDRVLYTRRSPPQTFPFPFGNFSAKMFHPSSGQELDVPDRCKLSFIPDWGNAEASVGSPPIPPFLERDRELSLLVAGLIGDKWKPLLAYHNRTFSSNKRGPAQIEIGISPVTRIKVYSSYPGYISGVVL